MIVVSGMSQYLIQMKIQISDKEKTAKRLNIQSFIGRTLDNSQACYNTLNPGTLTPAVLATDTAPFPEQKFQIDQLKDSAGGTLLNLETYKSGDTIPAGKAVGDIKDSTTEKKLKNLGIDKFEKLEFVYDKDSSSHGRVVLHSRTELKGLHEKKNPPVVWELSGISVTSNKVSLCAEATPLKILCGTTATGRPHGNGGGFVEGTATVDSTAYVGVDAVVCGTAKVKGNARVFGNAQITGNAEVKDNVLVYDSAKIGGNAVIKDNAKVYDNSEVKGSAVISDNAKVYKMATVSDTAQVYGNAKVYGIALVYNSAEVYGSAKVYGNAEVKGSGKVYGNARIHGQAQIYENARVYENAHVSHNGYVRHNGRVYGSVGVYEEWVSNNARAYGNVSIFKAVSGSAQVSGKLSVVHRISGSCQCIGRTSFPAGVNRDITTAPCSSGHCSKTGYYYK